MQRVRTLARKGAAAELAKGKQPPSYAVVSETELENLRNFLEFDPSSAARNEIEQRQVLQSVSKEREQNWPNTIEALRLKKEQDKVRKLQDKEDQACAIDEEERQFQQGAREQGIKKANLMLYEQDDRVKNFSAKMFLSQVLDERAKQVILARQKEEMSRQQEYKWAILQDESIRRGKEEEEAKLNLQKDRAKELCHAQRLQLQQVRERKCRERDEAREEGRQIRDAAERAVIKEKEADDMRRSKAIELNKQYVAENRRQAELRQQKVLDEQEEFHRIQRFAQLKEEQMIERKKRAEEKFNAKLAARQKMIDRQAELLENMARAEEERTLGAARAVEAEQAQKEKEKKEKRAKMVADIDASRRRQLAAVADFKEKDRAEKAAIARRLRKAEDEMMQEEFEERAQVRRRAERLQQFQQLQIKEKEVRKNKERHLERNEGLMMINSMQEEDKMFQSYVSSVMGDFTKKAQARRQEPGDDAAAKAATI